MRVTCHTFRKTCSLLPITVRKHTVYNSLIIMISVHCHFDLSYVPAGLRINVNTSYGTFTSLTATKFLSTIK